MWRVRLSRSINRLLGGKPEMMLSSRVYAEHRTLCIVTIDLFFYCIRGEVQHCRNCFYFDMTGGKYV